MKTPYYIKPETVCIGDTIRVTYKGLPGGIEESATGIAVSRQIDRQRTALLTQSGDEILSYVAGSKPPYTVTLLNRNEPTAVRLF